MLQLLFDKEIYHKVILEQLPAVRKFIWIGIVLDAHFVELQGESLRRNKNSLKFLDNLN